MLDQLERASDWLDRYWRRLKGPALYEWDGEAQTYRARRRARRLLS